MNKVYKIIWSRVKNCYVVVSEFARSRTKAPSASRLNRVVVAGMLTTFLVCGSLFPVAEAVTVTGSFQTPVKGTLHDTDPDSWTSQGTEGVFYGNSGFDSNYNKGYVTFTFDNASLQAAIAAVGGGSSGTTYTAGNGITINGETISAKAGTNVTVNSNGISVTGNGTVASGDTGLISGGKLYAEVRPSDNGNYVKHKNSI